MEYEHTDEYGSSSKLVTCGNEVDDRLNYGAGTISNIAFTFRSDGSNGFQGVNLYLFESFITGTGTYKRRFEKRGLTNDVKDHVSFL